MLIAIIILKHRSISFSETYKSLTIKGPWHNCHINLNPEEHDISQAIIIGCNFNKLIMAVKDYKMSCIIHGTIKQLYPSLYVNLSCKMENNLIRGFNDHILTKATTKWSLNIHVNIKIQVSSRKCIDSSICGNCISSLRRNILLLTFYYKSFGWRNHICNLSTLPNSVSWPIARNIYKSRHVYKHFISVYTIRMCNKVIVVFDCQLRCFDIKSPCCQFPNYSLMQRV